MGKSSPGYFKKYYAKNRERLLRASRKWEKENYATPSVRYRSYRSRAREKSIPFQLTLDQFKTFWQLPCFYCGGEIATIGLDRVDNSKGYEINNLVPCCIICNRMKHVLDQELFYEHVAKIVARHSLI